MKWAILILTFTSLKAFSQNFQDDVKKPVMLLFDGMRKADATMIKAAFAPGAILQTLAKDNEGKELVKTENIAEFIAAVTQPHPEVYDERISFDFIQMDSSLASVWTPYKFFIGNRFSHCGVNSFQLVKMNGEWKIQYLIDTRRKENCP